MSQNHHALAVRVERVREIAEGVKQLRLRGEGDLRLPAFEPGAHVDLLLPNGLSRSYSLTGPESGGDHYDVAIARDPASRGGSTCVHDELTEGASLRISAPRNNFPLHEGPAPAVLIAGGIGITPIWAMVQRLTQQGRPWQLHYACRTRQRAAFVGELDAAAASARSGEVHTWWDAEHDGAPLDVARIVRQAPAEAHLYCCGPVPMLERFTAETRAWPSHQVHLEHFRPPAEPAPMRGLPTFNVKLARSGQIVMVPEGSTILDALMMNGIDAPYSCCEGLCGTCETRVLEGVPDHRDNLLTERARQANDVMIICCSGSKTPMLVLDL